MSDNNAQPARTKPKVALTIAGYDPSNGAGITADLQVFAAHGIFGISAITALTVQSTLGVAAIHPVDPAILSHTLRHLVEDITPDGIKIGMLGSREAVSTVASFIQELIGRIKRPIPIVLDPVLRSSSGATLLEETALAALHEELLPFVSWITPNWSEIALLTQRPVSSLLEARIAAEELLEAHSNLQVVATGGDADGDAIDLWIGPNGESAELIGQRINTTATHGTGCAFSSALLCSLIGGAEGPKSVQAAKAYVEQALRSAPRIGLGKGPMALLGPLQQDRLSSL